jgi:hypothetical protein
MLSICTSWPSEKSTGIALAALVNIANARNFSGAPDRRVRMSVVQEVGELGCTIKQVKIPHSLASSLFFAYSVQDTKGQTPAFHADGILKLLNFSITIPYTRRETTQIQFSLLGRAPWGKALRIGTCDVDIPDAVYDGEEHAVDFTIQSEVGPFTVDVLFQLLEHDEDFVPEMHALLAGTSPMVLYEDVLSKDKPDITDAVRAQVYSPDEGIGARLAALAKHKPTNDDVQALERLLGPFQRDAERAREESAIWRDAIMGLFLPSPESVDMVSGARRKSNQVCDAIAPTIPAVALVLTVTPTRF